MGQHIVEATFTVDKRSADSVILLTRELWQAGLYVRDNLQTDSITVCGPSGLIPAAERICQKFSAVDDYTDSVPDDEPATPRDETGSRVPPPISSTKQDYGSD